MNRSTVAMTFQGLSVTYGRFFDDVDKFAAYLAHIGVKKGDSVGLCLPNFPSAVVAFYAIGKLGAIASVLHPLMPAEGLIKALNRTHTKILIYFDRFYFKCRDKLQENNIRVILASATDYLSGIQLLGMRIYNLANDRRIAALPECSKDMPTTKFYRKVIKRAYPQAQKARTDGSEVCLYLPSGGTSGEPKIVEITASALNSIASKIFGLTSGTELNKDSMLMVLPIFHGFGIAVCMHTVLSHGLRIVLVPAFRPESINRIIKRDKVTHLAGVPAMYDKLMKCGNFAGNYLKNIKNAYCGGDVLPEEIKERYDSAIARYGGKGRLYQGYGLAEAIAVCCSNSSKGEKSGSIGRPMEGIRIKAVGEDGRTLAPNQKGELCVAGDTLMKGYYGEEKSECLIDTDGTRWLATGDYGYIDEDGYVFFSGRKKRIIIVSGINVFPLEIEKEVNAMEEIGCSLASRMRLNGKSAVRLYIELKEGFSLDDKLKAKIVAALKNKFIKYYNPHEILETKLPRTPIGKIDYLKLWED